MLFHYYHCVDCRAGGCGAFDGCYIIVVNTGGETGAVGKFHIPFESGCADCFVPEGFACLVGYIDGVGCRVKAFAGDCEVGFVSYGFLGSCNLHCVLLGGEVESEHFVGVVAFDVRNGEACGVESFGEVVGEVDFGFAGFSSMDRQFPSASNSATP